MTLLNRLSPPLLTLLAGIACPAGSVAAAPNPAEFGSVIGGPGGVDRIGWAGQFNSSSNPAQATSTEFAADFEATSSRRAQDPPPADRSNEQTDDGLTDDEREQLGILGPVLLNPSQDIQARTRRGAAGQLLAMRAEPAYEVLRQALGSGESHVMRAVVESMQNSGRAVLPLQDALIETLRDCPDDVLRPLAAALALYGPTVIDSIAAIAHNDELSSERRFGAIYALSEFRARAAAIHLIALIDPVALAGQAQPPQAVMDAACDSLDRLTGLSYGRDQAAWSQWWSRVKDLSNEQWLSNLLDNLGDKISRLQTEVDQQQQQRRALERRLVEANRDMLRSISGVENQLARIPALLDDPLPAIRAVAIERVEILLRDAVKLPDEFQNMLATHVGDASPDIRRRVVQLLDELNYQELVRVLSSRLTQETDQQVRHLIVDIFARRHTPNLLPSLTYALQHPELRVLAADGIWLLLSAHAEQLDEHAEQLDEHAEAIEALHNRLTTIVASTEDVADLDPSVLRLHARLVADYQLDPIIALLDADQPELQAAVAAGLAARGAQQPLIERADISTIYPHAVHSLSHGPTTIAQLRRIIQLAPPDNVEVRIWHDAMRNLLVRFAPANLLEADDILAAIPDLSIALRIDVLSRGIDQPVELLPTASRMQLAIRLATLLLDDNQPVRAHELLASVNHNNGNSDDNGNGIPRNSGMNASDAEAFQQLRLHAAIRAGAFDDAARISNDAQRWIAFLSAIVAADAEQPERIQQLHNEIQTRFADSLSEAQRNLLQDINRRLAGASDADRERDSDSDGSSSDAEDKPATTPVDSGLANVTGG